MKKMILFLLCMVLCACMDPPAENSSPVIAEPLTAVVFSDLHYQESSAAVNTLMPLASSLPQFTETLVRQILDLHPDLVVITGDNTNNGRESEMKQLAAYLREIRDAGIEIIMIPGNHDMHSNNKDIYEKAFFPLLKTDSRDTETLSYSCIFRHTRFLAMDDSSASAGNGGIYPASTVRWLEGQLKEAEKQQENIIFLSHYSVLTGLGTDKWDSYRVQADGLLPLLKKYDVRLCFTGHQHSQNILRHDQIYEVVSASVLSLPCLFGILEVSDSQIEYHTRTVDFETYADPEFADTVNALSETPQESTFTDIVSEYTDDPDKQAGILRLIDLFFDTYARGKLGLYAEEIMQDPYYTAMNASLADTNYGPWMKDLIESRPLDASSLTIELH